LSGLTSSTQYYVRAYATNAIGTAYGSELSFSTAALAAQLCPNTPTVTDVDGNIYNTVQIGTQCWTQSNLKVSKYRNGDVITTGLSVVDWANTLSGACAIYNDDPSNNLIYGKLYNHYAVTDIRGLCPTGWHVPSSDDWNVMTIFLDPNSDTTCHTCSGHIISNTAGAMMKSTLTQPQQGGWPQPNSTATNISGFSGLPGGFRDWYWNYYLAGLAGDFWTSTQINTLGNSRRLAWDFNNFSQSVGLRTHGFSVRCLKD
jgi:uncharacterized protein (TIGR02145 family)